MSFNPTRLEQASRAAQRRVPDVGTGRTHAAIMARPNNQTSRPVTGPRVATRHGVAEMTFTGEAFVARRETMYAGNSIGYGVCETGDRLIMVERGMLFAFIGGDDGVVETQRLTPGATIQAPRGRAHGYATSGVEAAEFLVVETPDYATGWKQLQPATETLRAVPVEAPKGAPPPRVDGGVARAQATEMAETRTRRQQRAESAPREAINANSTSVVGVNPRPSGPPAE